VTDTTEATVLWEQAEGVGRITLNRPRSLNAWTVELGRELLAAVDAAAAGGPSS
jgi:enoyl-CoA hydratase/carnithine racemase